MKLVVGLGNPGRKYEGTRHNIGFVVLEELARRRAAGRRKTAFQGETADIVVRGERTLLLWPHTFMNRSGQSVVEARDFYKIDDQNILIIADDLNLPVAKLRFRARGSSGGQKGLADIIRALGSETFARLRLGIGTPPEGWDAADYVLGKFTKEQQSEIEVAVVQAADAAEDWIEHGIDHCMNRYNA